MKNRRFLAIVLVLALCAALSGCGLQSIQETIKTVLPESPAETESAPGAADNAASGESGAESAVTESAETTTPATTVSSELFTDRDFETDYSDYVTVTLADSASYADGEGVSIEDGTVTITEAGTFLLTGTLTDGQIVVELASDEKAQLVLDNASVTSRNSAALYIKSGDKVFLTTTEGSENLLCSAGSFVQTDGNSVDGAIFSKSDLTLNGLGTLTVTSAAGHGIVCKDDLKITGGVYSVTAAKDGLQANDSVRVAGGSLTILCGSDGMDVSNDEGTGYVAILSGEIEIDCDDDGIHTEQSLVIEGGSLSVTGYEGLEACVVTLSGGDVLLVTQDDGINATGSGAELTVSGGTLYINANGDALDANGSLAVSGGTVYIDGPSNGGNGILDYDAQGMITGGTLIGTGVSGMQVNFSQNSTQGSILYTLSGTQSAGTTVTLTDESGTVIAQITPEKAFSVVLVSAPEIVAGETYTLTVGSQSVEIEMSSLFYGSGMGMGGMFGGMGGNQTGGNMGGRGGW